MIKVKITFPYEHWPLSRQLPDKYNYWDNYEFDINPVTGNIKYDFWIVYNFLLESEAQTLCSEGNCILITGEPSSIETYNADYIRQFDHVITSNKKLNHKRLYLMPQAHPWFIGKTFDQLMDMQQVEKSKLMSVINSSKIRTKGHVKRRDFLEKITTAFKDKIDVFGKGVNFIPDKWNALAPYKFTLAIENTSQDYYFTEKIMDPFLSLTFPFYYGCKNLEDYFDRNSWLWIDINNFKRSKIILEEVLSDETFYEKKIQVLKKQKQNVLLSYNLFPMIINFINTTLKFNKETRNYREYRLFNINENRKGNVRSFFRKLNG